MDTPLFGFSVFGGGQGDPFARNIERRTLGGVSDWERLSGFTVAELRKRVESSYIVCNAGVYLNAIPAH